MLTYPRESLLFYSGTFYGFKGGGGCNVWLVTGCKYSIRHIKYCVPFAFEYNKSVNYYCIFKFTLDVNMS